MSRNYQYGNNYYDPVGSQSSAPSGYTYQTSSSTSAYPNAPTSSGYGANYQSYASNTYGGQQYASTTGQQTSTSASHAAQALSSLSGQEYNQTSSSNRASSTNPYDNSSWLTPGTASNVYSGSNVAIPNRAQSNNSPLYSNTQSSSTFGRLAVPEQTQSSSNTFAASQTYQNAPSSAGASSRYQSAHSQTPSQPPRYNSPLHAVQAQQHSHNKRASRGSGHLPSPQIAQAAGPSQQNRQQSASVEPSPTTVDPSQVYDNRAELQRKAQVEAEKRRKYEAEQAAKRAEEERIAAEKRKEDEEKQKAEKEAAAKKAENDRKNEQRRKAREEKKQSKSAATTLAQMASTSADASAAATGDEEAQMRLMFQKMREFNAKNPAMLAKLWDEERKSHEAAKASPASASKAPAHPKAPAAASPASAQSPSTSFAQHGNVRPLAKPAPGKATSPSIQRTPQTAMNQQPSPTVQNTTSLWPPHKKGALSEATAKWLMSLPQNVGKTINPDVVLNILNSNPSYVQLCEALEGFGMRFERSTLARELLKAVPDGLKAQPGPPKPAISLAGVSSIAAQVNGASKGSPEASKKKGRSKSYEAALQIAPSGTVSYEAPLSLVDAAREVNNMDQPAFQPMYGSPERTQTSPYFSQSQTLTNGSRPPSQSQQPPEVKREDKFEEPPRPPADKEEAARKRTFGDLVDLTAEDSDDEGPPAKKIMQLPNGPINGALTQPPHLQQPTSFRQFVFNQPKPAIPVPGQGMMYPPRAPNAQMTLPTDTPIQQQLNGGQPPTLQQPPMIQQPPFRSKGPTPEQLQQARMKGKMLVEPIMRDRVARRSNYDSRTIARDVLLATGRHPDMRGLNSHLVNMQKLLAAHGGEFDSGGNRSDLSTIRWDIIDPEPPKKSSKDEKDEDGKVDSAAREAPTPRIAQPNKATVDYETPTIEPGEFKPARRGRPPKSVKARYSMPNPDSARASLTNGLGGTTTPRQTSSCLATPSSAPQPAKMSSAVGYASFAQVTAEGKKKKGRPFGWRKEVHSREAQGLPKAQAAVAKLPGRPKGSGTPKQEQVAQPQYQVYNCGWAGCSAELHNLDTLKKHLVKVHGKKYGEVDGEGGVYKCLWKDCDAGDRFEGIEGWVQHVDKEHLQSIAWKLGDGPRGGVVSETSVYYNAETPPSYLSDSRGRSVTPIISPATPTTQLQPQPTSSPGVPAVARRGRPPKDGISKSAQTSVKQDTELKKLEDHLKVVGPTLERMGCVLASEERRQTFLDDEDFEDEGWGSEHDPGDEL